MNNTVEAYKQDMKFIYNYFGNIEALKTSLLVNISLNTWYRDARDNYDWGDLLNTNVISKWCSTHRRDTGHGYFNV